MQFPLFTKTCTTTFLEQQVQVSVSNGIYIFVLNAHCPTAKKGSYNKVSVHYEKTAFKGPPWGSPVI